MNVDRLNRLADALEVNAANPEGVKFDLRGWVKPADKLWGTGNHYETADEVIPLNCGTTACALGYAAISGIFKAEGLTAKTTHGRLVPMYDGRGGFDAAVAFFEVTTHQAGQLFESGYYDPTELTGAVGELAVATRIRELVATGQIKADTWQSHRTQSNPWAPSA